MCGRYSLDSFDLATLSNRFAADLAVDASISKWEPTYNVCPMTSEPIILQDDKSRRLGLTRWGWKRPFLKNRPMINARADDILAGKTKMFTKALRERRCIIPAASFYEWQRDANEKPIAPFAIAVRDQPIFAMAGLWENENEEGSQVAAHLVLTVAPNSLMASIHDREPMILRTESDVDRWLNPNSTVNDIADLLVPVPSEDLHAWQVSNLVNSIKNKGPELKTHVLISGNFLESE